MPRGGGLLSLASMRYVLYAHLTTPRSFDRPIATRLCTAVLRLYIVTEASRSMNTYWNLVSISYLGRQCALQEQSITSVLIYTRIAGLHK
ncbi:hypothetical protein BD414DRAFT_107429 [Trametes punicea]|nr:hypothetical protein BD414DRAFT_107429 [Trametes punicea]